MRPGVISEWDLLKEWKTTNGRWHRLLFTEDSADRRIVVRKESGETKDDYSADWTHSSHYSPGLGESP